MTDYTDPLGKWVEENISRFTEKIAVDNRPFPIIDSLSMLRAYVAETTAERREFREALESELEEALNLAQSRLREMLNECKRRVAAEAELAEAQQRFDKQIQKYENDEASVCPEDVGFMEYIGVLQKQLAEARRDSARMVEDRSNLLFWGKRILEDAEETGWSGCGDHCRNSCRWCGLRNAIDAAMAEAQPAKCVSCGKQTEWCCADCMIDTGVKVGVCESSKCRLKHEAAGCTGKPPAMAEAQPKEPA